MKGIALVVGVLCFIIVGFWVANKLDERDRPIIKRQSEQEIRSCHDIGGKAVLRPNAYGDWTFRECIQ